MAIEVAPTATPASAPATPINPVSNPTVLAACISKAAPACVLEIVNASPTTAAPVSATPNSPTATAAACAAAASAAIAIEASPVASAANFCAAARKAVFTPEIAVAIAPFSCKKRLNSVTPFKTVMMPISCASSFSTLPFSSPNNAAAPAPTA